MFIINKKKVNFDLIWILNRLGYTLFETIKAFPMENSDFLLNSYIVIFGFQTNGNRWNLNLHIYIKGKFWCHASLMFVSSVFTTLMLYLQTTRNAWLRNFALKSRHSLKIWIRKYLNRNGFWQSIFFKISWF